MKLTSTTGFRAAIGAAAAALLVVLVTPTPAFANNIMVSGSAVNVGESPGTSTVTVRNADLGKADGVRVSVSVSGEAASFVDVSVGGGCKGNGNVADCGKIKPMGEKSFTVTVKMKGDANLKEGESKSGNLDFKIEGPHSGAPGSAPVTVTGFTQVTKAIAGMVTDLDDKGIGGAKVTVHDGGTKYGPATTGGDGKFSIPAELTTETTLKYEVTKKGYETGKGTYDFVPGQAVNIVPRLDKKDSEKAEPTKAAEDGGDSEDTDEGGFTFITWVLIILGVLLAIGGVFAIWMLLRKGKEEDEDEEKLPDEPVTHQLSASQTGKFGVYEGSGMRPGTDNPTMIHSGGLIRDDDLARYGSEPPSAAGFGPAYNEGRPTQAVQSPGEVPPAGTTQRYAASEPASGSWQSDEPASGATQRYPAAEPASGGWQSNQPVSGADQRYPAEPASGSWRSNEPASGSWQSNEPVSGSTQRYPAAEPASGSWRSNEPASGGWQSNQPVSGADQRYPAEPAPGSWRSNEPAPASWQSNEPVSGSTQRYPAADPGSGGRYPSENSYGDRGAQYDDRGSGGRHYREPDPQGGYGEQQPQQPSGRRYRDDDYGDFDDRPRSW